MERQLMQLLKDTKIELTLAGLGGQSSPIKGIAFVVGQKKFFIASSFGNVFYGNQKEGPGTDAETPEDALNAIIEYFLSVAETDGVALYKSDAREAPIPV